MSSKGNVIIVDYGAGNLTSVASAVSHLGRKPVIARDPEAVVKAERIIFPGVGAAGASMDTLKRLGLDRALREAREKGVPMLGICIGCQVIFDESEEDGGTSCLGLIPGKVKGFRFPAGAARKIPHMGWNEVAFRGDHPVFRGIPEGSQFYFVHSYYPCPEDGAAVLGTAMYGGIRFAVAVARGSLTAVQFHAEKSGPPGLRILENFFDWSPS